MTGQPIRPCMGCFLATHCVAMRSLALGKVMMACRFNLARVRPFRRSLQFSRGSSLPEETPLSVSEAAISNSMPQVSPEP